MQSVYCTFVSINRRSGGLCYRLRNQGSESKEQTPRSKFFCLQQQCSAARISPLLALAISLLSDHASGDNHALIIPSLLKLGASSSNFCFSAAAVASASPAPSLTFHTGEGLTSGDLEKERSKDRLTLCSLLGPACPNMSLFWSPVLLEVNSLPLLGRPVT